MRSSRNLGVLAAMLLVAAGCNNQPAGPVVVQGMKVNEYEFDYELVSPSSIRADAQVLSISTGQNQIGITDGKLSVDVRPYDMVKPKDRISVVGGKVSVNGQERKPDA
jgi:hypothetical protein